MNFYHKVSLFLLISLIFLTGCKKEENKTKDVIRNVLLTEVETSGELTGGRYSGVVEEGKNVNAAFMTGGKLKSVELSEGSRVRKGQLIATLDDTDYKIGVNQLEVQYSQMKGEKARMDEMFARHNIAPNDYEKFEAGFKQLELQLEMARNKLEYTRLYSPSDGYVAFRYMEPGELVDAGTPIYKITDDNSLKVRVDMPLDIYLNRKNLINIYGHVPGVTENIPLTVESFVPDADNNQLFHLILNVPKGFVKELTTGMNIVVTAEIKNAVEGETVVPSRSLFFDNGRTYVWIFNSKDSTINRKEVKVDGQPYEGKTKVKGLSGEEKIVTAGVKQLKEGEKVGVLANP